MKYVIAVVALMLALSANPAEARGPRLWTPGIVMSITFEGFIARHSGPRLVWRGNWVSVRELRGRHGSFRRNRW